MAAESSEFSLEEAQAVGIHIGIDWATAPFTAEDFRAGMTVELEHGARDLSTDVTHDDPLLTGKIALAHLNEFPDYYQRLRQMELAAEAAQRALHLDDSPSGLDQPSVTPITEHDEKRIEDAQRGDDKEKVKWTGIENRQELSQRLRDLADDIERGRLHLGDAATEVPDRLGVKLELEAKEHRREVEFEVEISWSMEA
jgi:amphi-Trp domain-containing protein